MHEITEWCTSGAREYGVVHGRCTSTSGTRDGCTRVRSGVRVRVVHEWCTSVVRVQVVHERCTSTRGAREVHVIA